MTHGILCMIRGTKSEIIRVSHACATNKFKVHFKSINSSSSLSRSPTSQYCNLFAMPRIPQPLGVAVVPTLRQRLLSAVFTSTNRILSFDQSTRSLVTYYWYVIQMFVAWHLSMFAQARWRERVWDLERLTIIEKPMTSLGRAAYARCWRRSEEILTLQK